MNPTLTFLALAIAVQTVVAAVVLGASRRTLPADLGQRYAAPCAFATACVTGYVLTDAIVFPPERHWQWIVPLAIGSSLISSIANSKSLRFIERLVLWLLTNLVAAWLIVPEWASLDPPRLVWIAGLVPCLTLLTALVEPLATRIPAPSRLLSYAIASFGVATLTTAFLSLTYGKLAVVPAAALAGCFLGSLWGKGGPLQGLGLPYAVVIGGWAFIAAIDPPEPMWLLLIAAVSPLALWFTAIGPAARLRGWPAVATRLGSVIAVLTLCAAGLIATVGLP